MNQLDKFQRNIIVSQMRTKLGWLKRQILYRYHSFVKTEIINIKGIKLQIDPYMSEPVQKVIYHGDYEKQEFRILQSQLNQNDVVMEVGTGLGLLSSFCAKKIGSKKVFSYEANPELEPYIRKTYQIIPILFNLATVGANGIRPWTGIFCNTLLSNWY
jgi:hypothetical protein